MAEAGVPGHRAPGFKQQWEQAAVGYKGDFVLLRLGSVFKLGTGARADGEGWRGKWLTYRMKATFRGRGVTGGEKR